MLFENFRKSFGLKLLRMIGGNEEIVDSLADAKKVRARLTNHFSHGHVTRQDIELAVRIAQLAGIYGYRSHFGDFFMTLGKEREGSLENFSIDFGHWPHAFSLSHTLINGQIIQAQRLLCDKEPASRLYPMVAEHLYELSK